MHQRLLGRRAAAAAIAAAAVLWPPHAPAVLDGKLAERDAHPECVALGTRRDWVCSGVLVAPNVVVTAWHCFDEPLARLALGADPDTGTIVSIERLKPVRFRSLDVGAIVLPSPVAAIHVAIAPHVRAGAFTVVAFGGRTRDSNGGGLMRTRRIHAHPCTRNDTLEGNCRCIRGYTMIGDAAACRGDSGGGVYAGGRLAGFVSCFTNAHNDCGAARTVFVRADRMREWMRSVAAELQPAAHRRPSAVRRAKAPPLQMRNRATPSPPRAR